MRRKTFIAATGIAALAGSLLAAPPASAHTGEPPYNEALLCFTSTYVDSCFEFDGDDFWVRDNRADGRSAVVVWSTSYNRYGSCRNSHGAGKWHECKYDMAENQFLYWDHYVYDGDTGSMQWVAGPYDAFT